MTESALTVPETLLKLAARGIGPGPTIPLRLEDSKLHTDTSRFDDCGFRARCIGAILGRMATSTLISVREYLNTTYRPDRDYIDGEVRERNLGERPHSLLQILLGSIFLANLDAWNMLPMTEQRVQTSATHFRIPDLCVVRRDDPADRIVHIAPLLCIEILSREDRLREVQERVDDYLGMRVQHIWVIDPDKRIGYVGGEGGFVKPAYGLFAIEGTPIQIDLGDLFKRLDQLKPGS